MVYEGIIQLSDIIINLQAKDEKESPSPCRFRGLIHRIRVNQSTLFCREVSTEEHIEDLLALGLSPLWSPKNPKHQLTEPEHRSEYKIKVFSWKVKSSSL